MGTIKRIARKLFPSLRLSENQRALRRLQRRIGAAQTRRLRAMRNRPVTVLFTGGNLVNGRLPWLCRAFLEDARYRVVVEDPVEEGCPIDLPRCRQVDTLDRESAAALAADIVFTTFTPGGFVTDILRENALDELPLIGLVPYSTAIAQGDLAWGLRPSDFDTLPDHCFGVYWRLFVDNRFARDELLALEPALADFCVVSGSPRVDGFREPLGEPEGYWPRPKAAGAKRVLWSPRHAVTTAEFEAEARALLALAAAQAELDVVLRPHPYLVDPDHALVDETVLRETYRALRAATNIRIDCLRPGPFADVIEPAGLEDYHAAFRTSDALVCSGESFLAEYLPTGKPIVSVTIGPDWTNSFGRAVEAVCYTASSSAEIEERVTALLIDGDDPLREQRAAFTQREVLLHGGCVSDFIKRYVDEQVVS